MYSLRNANIHISVVILGECLECNPRDNRVIMNNTLVHASYGDPLGLSPSLCNSIHLHNTCPWLVQCTPTSAAILKINLFTQVECITYFVFCCRQHFYWEDFLYTCKHDRLTATVRHERARVNEEYDDYDVLMEKHKHQWLHYVLLFIKNTLILQ